MRFAALSAALLSVLIYYALSRAGLRISSDGTSTGRWLCYGDEYYVVANDVAVRATARGGRGVVALKDIPKGKVFSSTPLQCMVNIEHALASQINVNNALDVCSDLEAMALYLIFERRKGDASKRVNFWNTLPDEPPRVPLLMSNAEVHAFKVAAPRFFNEAERLRNFMETRYDAISDVFAHVLRFTKREFFQSIALVQSRVHSVRVRDSARKWVTALCMAPFADMLNAPSALVAPNARCETDETSTVFQCKTTSYVRTGEELVVAYAGDSTNVDLLMSYGFTRPLPGAEDRAIHDAFLQL